MEYVIGFAVGLVVGVLAAKLADILAGGVSTNGWLSPVQLLVTGGTLDRNGVTSTPALEAVQNKDIVTTAVGLTSLFQAKGNECLVSLGGSSRIDAMEDTEADGTKYMTLDLASGSLSYLGLVSPTMRMMGPGRRFIVRSKRFAVGARGTNYTVVTDGATMTVTVSLGAVDITSLDTLSDTTKLDQGYFQKFEQGKPTNTYPKQQIV